MSFCKRAGRLPSSLKNTVRNARSATTRRTWWRITSRSCSAGGRPLARIAASPASASVIVRWKIAASRSSFERKWPYTVAFDMPSRRARSASVVAREPRPRTSSAAVVRAVRELRDLEHARPGERGAAARVVVDLADLGVVRHAYDLVAADAPLDGWEPRVLRARRVGVAVLAGDLERAGVDHVVEEDRLLRRARRPREPRRSAAVVRLCERAHEGDEAADLIGAERAVERRHRGREPLRGPAVGDHADEELVGQPVHEAPVGEVGGPGGEARGRGAVAAAALSVTGGAVGGEERAAGLDLAFVSGRGDRAGRGDVPRGQNQGGQPQRRAAGGPGPAPHAACPPRPLLAAEAFAALQKRVTDGAVHVDHALLEALEQVEVERPLVHDVAHLHAEPVPEERQEIRERVEGGVDGLAHPVAHRQRLEKRHDHVRPGPNAPDTERLPEVLAALEDAEDVLGRVEQAADTGGAVEEQARELAAGAHGLSLQQD